MSEALAIFGIGFILMFYVLCIAIGIGMYLLNSFGLMGLLKTVGEKSPGLAFVPYLNSYYLGRVGSKDPNKFSKLGITLVIMQIVMPIFAFVLGFTTPFIEEGMLPEEIIIIPVLLTVLVALAYMVIYYVAYSRIFLKFSKNGLVFTLVNIFVGGCSLAPIFLFVIRNNKPVDQIDNTAV